jgi:hypothetical protein
LTVLQEAGDRYLGGYLVTNRWGRPLEFRLTSAVQPNRVQQILYARTLVPYICADLIGKTLVDKAGVPVQLVVTDREPVLDLRLKLEVPVVYLLPPDDPRATADSQGAIRLPRAQGERGTVVCHARFPADELQVRQLLEQIDGSLDLTEPFTRIREAISEARKLGVTNRSAA